jgi:hypothetical protein
VWVVVMVVIILVLVLVMLLLLLLKKQEVCDLFGAHRELLIQVLVL